MRQVNLIFGILMLFGCAQQVAPTGGPKDETPPKILGEIPANLSTNFTGKQIEIPFDEYIQLQSASEQIVISPPMLKTPTYQLRRKSLVIKFEQELAENTTYTINFGEAIVDNNEGNILKNYTYVFSTGAHLDSMEVKGKLTDVLSGEPEKDALVMLYKNDIDSLPLDTIPDYFTRTDESGHYHIKNIANQQYKIFALKDENANYKFDVPTEKIGFLDSLVTPFSIAKPTVRDSTLVDSVAVDTTAANLLDSKKAEVQIPSFDMVMFVEEDTTQFLKKAVCDHYGKLQFIYNRPVTNFDLSLKGFSSKKQWKLVDFNSSSDSITVWITDVVPDTMRCLIKVDSYPQDTIEIVMKPLSEAGKTSSVKVKGRKKEAEKFGLTAKFNPPKGRSPKPDEALQIVWNHPILGFDISKLKLYEDSVRVIYDVQTSDPSLRKFDIAYEWKKDRQYQLLVVDSAFTDLYNLWNDTIETGFRATGNDGFGSLVLVVAEAPIANVLVELISSSGQLIERKSVQGTGSFKFEKLLPGTYSIDVIHDRNANGKWDSGRYSEKLQPETIERVQSSAEVRGNWELELEWNPNNTPN
jgi:uncharacterized protein (DUF2141 family)